MPADDRVDVARPVVAPLRAKPDLSLERRPGTPKFFRNIAKFKKLLVGEYEN
jgi:hypothetical protein